MKDNLEIIGIFAIVMASAALISWIIYFMISMYATQAKVNEIFKLMPCLTRANVEIQLNLPIEYCPIY